MQRSIRFASLILLLLTTMIFTASCTKKNKSAYGLDLAETLRWNIQSEPPSLDWTISTDTTSSRLTDAMMDGLVSYGFNANEVVTIPALASSWEASTDQKTWTFTLRNDVKWTDGVPFVAQQVLDGWERLLNPKTGAEYANFLFNVKNAEKYFQGKLKNFSEVGVKINEQGQVVVELETPQSFFPSLLAHHSTYPIRKDIIEKFGTKWIEPGNYVTLGAYKLKIWEHDKAVVLERNDSYYGTKPKIKYIHGMIITSQSTAMDMFRKGEVDALDEIPSIECRPVKAMPEYNRHPILAMYYYGINVKKPPMDDVRVRKAINMAINREEVNTVLCDSKFPAYNVVPPGLLGHNKDIGMKFDAAAANKLLDDAGYKDRSKFPRIQLGFNTNENHQRIAENVQQQIKKNLGIEIGIVNEEWKTYLKSLQAKNYQFFRMGWVADYPDADTFINLFVTGGGNNHTLWGNKKYDELIKKGSMEANPEQRKAIYAEAQKILNEEDVPVIPLYYYADEQLVAKRVKNYPINAMHKFYIKNAELTE
jgi:oligopeptide transport system substrate-binding protein